MRGKSLVLIIIALGCGLVASIGISQIMDKKPVDSSHQMKMGKIYVAIVDVDINEPLNAEMVKLEEWPQDKIPEGAITKTSRSVLLCNVCFPANQSWHASWSIHSSDKGQHYVSPRATESSPSK